MSAVANQTGGEIAPQLLPAPDSSYEGHVMSCCPREVSRFFHEGLFPPVPAPLQLFAQLASRVGSSCQAARVCPRFQLNDSVSRNHRFRNQEEEYRRRLIEALPSRKIVPLRHDSGTWGRRSFSSIDDCQRLSDIHHSHLQN